jgi:transcriptional regulator with XRE-family HTH domain
MPLDLASLPVYARQIHLLRRSRGWSQPELAERGDISAAMIGRYERGEMTPPADVLAKLATAFGVTIDHLYHGSSAPDILHDKAMLGRWETLSALPSQDRSFIVAALDALLRDAKARQAYGGGNPSG